MDIEANEVDLIVFQQDIYQIQQEPYWIFINSIKFTSSSS